MWSLIVAGALAGFALIVAIGAQNAWVLRQGVRREHVLVVVAVCILSDVLLITAGTAGIGALVKAAPVMLEVLRWAGAAYLVWFGISSIRSALKPQALMEQAPRSAKSVLATTLALTWLNPHVYLDTVVLLGSLANQHGPDERWLFALGACVASTVWFTALGFGARGLARLLARPRAWQIIDIAIGVIMFALAAKLLLGA